RRSTETAMVTILTESGEHAVAGAEAASEALWCHARVAETVTGWGAKPEGLDQGPTCVPLPTGTIGAGAVIGAGSLGNGAIPPDVLAVGVPARVVRTLDAPRRARHGVTMGVKSFSRPGCSTAAHGTSSHSSRHVVIAGGGVAGLASALILGRPV